MAKVLRISRRNISLIFYLFLSSISIFSCKTFQMFGTDQSIVFLSLEFINENVELEAINIRYESQTLGNPIRIEKEVKNIITTNKLKPGRYYIESVELRTTINGKDNIFEYKLPSDSSDSLWWFSIHANKLINIGCYLCSISRDMHLASTSYISLKVIQQDIKIEENALTILLDFYRNSRFVDLITKRLKEIKLLNQRLVI